MWKKKNTVSIWENRNSALTCITISIAAAQTWHYPQRHLYLRCDTRTTHNNRFFCFGIIKGNGATEEQKQPFVIIVLLFPPSCSWIKDLTLTSDGWKPTGAQKRKTFFVCCTFTNIRVRRVRFKKLINKQIDAYIPTNKNNESNNLASIYKRLHDKLTSDFKEMQGKAAGRKKKKSAALSVWGHKTGAQSNKSDC